jgi:hypothetical protein
MKSCPTCRRTFEDTFTFCLADGSLLSPPFDPHATQRLPSSRETAPPPTEVMNAAAFPSPLPPAQPALDARNLPPTIASPPPSNLWKRESVEAVPARRSALWYSYLLAILAGLIVGLLYRYVGFRFFSLSAMVLLPLLIYGALGTFFGFVWPQKGWKWGIWITALWWLFEAVQTLPYIKIIVELDLWWLPVANLILPPLAACVGAYVGARLSPGKSRG